MRNDSHDDLNLVSGLRATDDDHEVFNQPAAPVAPSMAVTPVKSGGSQAILWVLLLLLAGALAFLVWWGRGQLEQINAQLIATQDSFAQTSEAAAGQLQDISGKVVATESTLTAERESMKLRIKQLETQQADLQKQVQAFNAQANALKDQQQKLDGEIKAQKSAVTAAEAGLKRLEQGQAAISTELTSVKRAQPQLEPLNNELASLKRELAELKKADTGAALRRIEQDVFVLRSELESRASTQNTSEFDAFRAQMTRHINTLQSQVQNLQQQLDARR